MTESSAGAMKKSQEGDDYQRVIASLRVAYGPGPAALRDGWAKEEFKEQERRHFLDLLRERGAASLLEVGAGPGTTRCTISEILVPGGLLYVGTWGGKDEEGPVDDPRYPVPRFFAFRSDQAMRQLLTEQFDILSFVAFERPGNNRFQSFMLQKTGIQRTSISRCRS